MQNIPQSISVNSLNDWLRSDIDNPIIIDVRERSEINIACLPFVDIYIPISEVSLANVSSQIKNYSDRQFVVLCHSGVRSYNFAQWMLENKLANEVWNLEEGIDGWSVNIDPKIPRY